MRRAQVETQTLMYALSAIIAVFLLLFGYSAIANFQGEGQNAEQLVFENSLKKRFNSVDYGTEFPVDLFLPQKYNAICFLNSKQAADTDRLGEVNIPHPGDPMDSQCNDDPVIQSSMKIRSRSDVFLVEGARKIATAAYTIGNLSVNYDNGEDTLKCFCVNATAGKVSFYLKGLGRTVEVRPVKK